VLAPLSCIPHWQREFDAWTPELFVVSYSGNQDSRDFARGYEMGWRDALADLATQSQKDKIESLPRRLIRPNVVLASYDTMRGDTEFFKSVDWQVLVVDEVSEMLEMDVSHVPV
jgi:SNF2 family DNA or RNA helicase